MAKITLRNGAIYNIADYATPNSFVILLGFLTVAEVLETLTEENLSEIQFMTDSEAVTGVYRNKLLCGYADNGDTLEVGINDADLVRHGLTLDEDGRIVSAVPQRYAPDGAVIVDKLPDGDVSEYRYVDGEYIYDPLPTPEPEEQPLTQEERITALEEENAVLLECLLEMSEVVYA